VGELFRFVQLEFPWAPGPPDGRYVLRGHAGIPAHVLVIKTLGAPQRRLLGRRRRPEAVPPQPPPEPVATVRVTIVDPASFANPAEAAQWLKDADDQEQARAAIVVLGDAVRAHRIAAGDPSMRAPSLAQALVCRLGYGQGEQVAEGRWVEARTITGPSTKERRTASLGPQQRFGALLSGRDVALAAETLALDARRDLDAGLYREAALHLRVALEAALAELVPWESHADVAERLGVLATQREPVARAANAALRGGLDDADIAAVTEALRTVEAALRARAAAVSGLLR
jgi:hypothetical protein